MKITRRMTALLLMAVIVLSASIERSMADGWCDSKCDVRCSKAGRRDRCLKYCGICCDKCHCVPSGTYGNKDECPCYRDMKNSKETPNALELVGGRIVEYEGLTLVTVRGAGHMVPLTKPSESLAIIHSYISSELLPPVTGR